MKTIAVIGWKNSGKTTLVSNLTNYYSKKGMKVGVIKHAHHTFDIDHEGTDSYKIRKSGAYKTTIASDLRLAHMVEQKGLDKDINYFKSLNQDCDILIFEGFKKNKDLKKIEVQLKKNNKEDLFLNTTKVLAVITDIDKNYTIPFYRHDDIEAIAKFILLNT
jgi:molybdopterin-guanine dinucleotide biosynthesis protein B